MSGLRASLPGWKSVMGERNRVLDTTIANIQKRFGEGAIMRLGDATHMQVDAIPTGALSLDIALGVGGVPRGRVIEIYGPESSGKTTLCQHIIAEAQKRGGICAFIDMEHALDPSYAAKCGVDIDNLYVSQPDTGEQALEIADALIRSGTMDVVVIDSVAAPCHGPNRGDGDAHVGLQARLMSQRCASFRRHQADQHRRHLHQPVTHEDCRVRQPETTSGGNAPVLRSVRLDIRRIQAIKEGGDVTGNRTRVVKKNKVAPPFTECEFDIMYNEGISRSGDVLDLGVEYGPWTRGAYSAMAILLLGQGRENAKSYLIENPP